MSDDDYVSIRIRRFRGHVQIIEKGAPLLFGGVAEERMVSVHHHDGRMMVLASDASWDDINAALDKLETGGS